MSSFPITRYRLFNDPFDRFFGDQLSFFDPWSDFEMFPPGHSMIPSSFRWINRPQIASRTENSNSSFHSSSTQPFSSVSSEKFRVQMNVDGFRPETIRTRVEGRRVIVEAKQEDRQVNGDYVLREVRKTYDLPENADVNSLASFVTPDNTLVIEVPFRRTTLQLPTVQHSILPSDSHSLGVFGNFRDPIFDYHGFIHSPDFRPRIVNVGTNGQKQLQMSLAVKNYRPEQINVSIKNNELRIQAEHSYNDGNRSERSFLTKSITLPPGTQIEQLKTFLKTDGYLEIEAPFIEPSQARQIDVQRL